MNYSITIPEPNLPKIIGISGVARSGKDTLSLFLENYLKSYGHRVKRYSFAMALKQDLERFVEEKCNASVWTNDSVIKANLRDLLVWYGTTWWRNKDPYHWVSKVKEKIIEDIKLDPYDYAIISDIRYPNEIKWIRQYGFTIHLSAYRETKKFYIFKKKTPILPANSEESKNNPELLKLSDFKYTWEMKDISPDEITENKSLIDQTNEFFKQILPQ